MVAGVLEELGRERPRRRFTIGITDDVSGTSLPYDAALDIEPPETVRAVFFGLGSDGTVGANKNTIKILGSEERLHAQGYFVYDSKKSGSQTVSHLRFGPQPISAPYLVSQASFVGCHQFGLLERPEVLDRAAPGATLLLNCRHPPDRVWDALARPVQEQILAKRTAAVRDRRRADRPRVRVSPGGPTRCCRPASSRSPECWSASRRSNGSRRRSTRPTAGAAPRWSSATRPRSTGRWTGCTGSSCPSG